MGEAKVHAPADFSLSGLGPLAAALEGRQVKGRFRHWVARVHGVHLDDRSCWIQIAREDDASASVVLRCSHRATADQAAAVLGHWQPTTSLSLLVLNVMAVAKC
jgi:uncharacterized protein YejL (UPF0352 family)